MIQTQEDMQEAKAAEVTYVFLGELAGYVAMWAVRQSPYPVPDGLEAALRKFQDAAAPLFTIAPGYKGGMRAFKTRGEINSLLEEHLFPIPEVAAWNNRKNGREGMGIASRYGGPEPDDDFIDLYALTQNVSAALIPYEVEVARKARGSETKG